MKYRSYHLLLAGIFSLLTTGAMAEKTDVYKRQTLEGATLVSDIISFEPGNTSSVQVNLPKFTKTSGNVGIKILEINGKDLSLIHILRWHFAVASLALLLTIGGFWMNSIRDNINEEFIKVIAQQNQMHVLPDLSLIHICTRTSMLSHVKKRHRLLFSKDRNTLNKMLMNKH